MVDGRLCRNGRVLRCHRIPDRDRYPDTWDLPGGHVEEGGQPGQALAQELWEELGMRVTPPMVEPFAHVQGADFRMDAWLIGTRTGQSSSRATGEHDALAWANAEEAPGLQLADPRLASLMAAALACSAAH